MGFKTILAKFFRGYVVLEEVESAINGKIEVREDLFGKRRLMVGGLTQSGGPVETLWRKVLRELKNSKTEKPRNVLILGLAAGSAARLIAELYPGIKIVGVEIDLEMIRLGRKYFGLDKIPNLKIRVANAISAISHKQSLSLRDMQYAISKFDLILVDLYCGGQVPKGAETEEFLEKVRECLNDNGVVMFNRLYYSEKKEKTDEFGEKLKKFFGQIEAKKVAMNKLFLCRK